LIQINNNVTYTSSTISGSNGNDTLTGGKGNDSIDGDNDNDTLSGGWRRGRICFAAMAAKIWRITPIAPTT